MKVAGYALVTSVLLAGCDGRTSPTTDPTPSPSPASATATSGGTTPTTTPPSPAARAVRIPDASERRLIQVGDTPEAAVREALSQTRRLDMVKLPCASAAPASESLVVDRNAINMAFGLGVQPIHETVWEMLTQYRPGAAAQYMSDLTAALARCATDQGIARMVAARSFAGDESVLILSTYQGGLREPVPSSAYRAVIRAGDVVMVLDVQPLESGITERATADKMIDVALRRAQV